MMSVLVHCGSNDIRRIVCVSALQTTDMFPVLTRLVL